jgi:predicted O-methyltransferase YrrM
LNSVADRIRGRVARALDRLGVLGLADRLPETRRTELAGALVKATLTPDAFREWERRGLHITPVHFYQPVPDTSTLPERLWARPSELAGLDLREDEQLRALQEISTLRGEYDALPDTAASDPLRFHFGNPAFGPVDGEVLYAMVRLRRPRRVIEVGSGWSTRLIAEAIRVNAGEDPASRGHLVSIDPTPQPLLAPLAEVRTARIQDIEPSFFDVLDRDDILFIDSSHVVSIGSDVVFEVLDVLPRLRPGVLVHFHDIFLPAEYPREWVLGHHRFWNEQYLVQAFLAFNSGYEIVLANAYLAAAHPERLHEVFRRYGPGVQPGSLWLRRRG